MNTNELIAWIDYEIRSYYPIDDCLMGEHSRIDQYTKVMLEIRSRLEAAEKMYVASNRLILDLQDYPASERPVYAFDECENVLDEWERLT